VALARKGRRSIEVEGERFHWVVSRRLADRRGTSDADLHLSLVVQHAGGAGARLEAGFEGELSRCVPAKGFVDDQTLTLAPAVVRAVIVRALALGWRPTAPGRAVRLEHQERVHPETTRPLIADRAYDPARLAEYLRDATLVYPSDQ
jgi:hypothetical protein